MKRKFDAVIFDMDGVLIDSEPLWREAMISAFTKLGYPFTEEDCVKTTGKRFDVVIKIWFDHFNETKTDPILFEQQVIEDLIELIRIKGKAINGVLDVLSLLKKEQIKIGLATSSNEKLMNFILNFLGISSYFHSVKSAQHLKHGKPHPEVYLACAEGLGCLPSRCLVIEDSVNGLISGMAAGMKVIAIPDEVNYSKLQWSLAEQKVKTMHELQTYLESNL